MYDAMLSTADSTDTDWMLSVYDTISYFADELVLRLAPDRQLSFHSADDVRQGISNLIQDVPEDEVRVSIMVCSPTSITLVFHKWHYVYIRLTQARGTWGSNYCARLLFVCSTIGEPSNSLSFCQ